MKTSAKHFGLVVRP